MEVMVLTPAFKSNGDLLIWDSCYGNFGYQLGQS